MSVRLSSARDLGEFFKPRGRADKNEDERSAVAAPKNKKGLVRCIGKRFGCLFAVWQSREAVLSHIVRSAMIGGLKRIGVSTSL